MEKRIIRLKRLGKNKFLLLIGEREEGVYTYGTVKRYGFSDGDEVSEKDIDSLYEKFIIPFAKERVLRLLSKRERSEKEIEEYLRHKHYSKETIDRVIEDFTSSKLVDNRRFAEIFVRSRFETSPRGVNLLSRELREKGIPEHVIQDVLQDYDEEEALERVINRVKKRYKNRRDKLIKYLLQKGFDYYLILQKVNET